MKPGNPKKKAKSLASRIVRKLPPEIGVPLIRTALHARNKKLKQEPVYHENPVIERKKTNKFYKKILPGGYEKRGNLKETRQRFQAIKNEVKGRVAEIGCADGYFSRRFAELGHKTVGVDFSEHLIKLAKKYKQKNVEFILGTAEHIPLKRNSFDTVFLGEILEHVKNIKTVLKEAHRIIKPRGTIIITAPTHLMKSPDHRRTLTPQALKKEIKELGEIQKKAMINVNYWYCTIKAKK